MTTRSPFRWLVCLGILTLTLITGAAGVASASSGIPMADDGGSGGGGGAGTLDETDRALALIEVSNTSVASGDEDWPPTANERSIQLIESTYAPDGFLAGNPAPPARVAYEDSEHAVAQNRFGVAVAVVDVNRGQPH